MSYTNGIASSLRNLRLPQTQQERFALAIGTTAVLGTTLVLPVAYRDYRTFISYGPGGVPCNVLGWLIVRVLLQPFAGEMLSTDVYVRRVAAVEGHGRGDDGFLVLAPEQARSVTGRPIVGPHVVPQRQLTQVPDEAIMAKLLAAFQAFECRNDHLVQIQPSWREAHADGLYIADHIPKSELAKQFKCEIAHIHSGFDHSAHMMLSPADCKKVIEAGWGQRHGFAGTSAMTWLSLGTRPNIPAELILVYAPRNEAEIDTFMQIVAAAVKFMTGREDVR